MSLGTLGAMASTPSRVELTIYSKGFGLVREQRTLYLRVGEQSVAIEDLAEKLDASTVTIRSLNKPGSFCVVEQTFHFDPMTPTSILERNIGRKAVLARITGETVRERTTGMILSAPTGVQSAAESGPTWEGMVFKADDGRFILSPTGQIEVAQLPKHLFYKPTLLWEVSSTVNGEQPVEMTYITQGLGWSAGYVLWVDESGTRAELKGWINVTNQTGTHYNDALIRVVEGSNQRNGHGDADQTSQEVGLRETEIEEVAHYELQRPATLRHGETKQLMYTETGPFEVSRKLVLDPLAKFKGRMPSERAYGIGRYKPLTLFAFTNDNDSDLGLPLPPGPVQVFQRYGNGSSRIVGEDRIGHIHPHEAVTLIAGYSQDVTVLRKRVHFDWLEPESRSACTETFELTFSNDGVREETIHLVERNWAAGTIKSASTDFQIIDPRAVLFVATVPPRGSVTISYTVESRW